MKLFLIIKLFLLSLIILLAQNLSPIFGDNFAYAKSKCIKRIPEELREVALLRRQLTKNIIERIKRYEKKTKGNRVVIK